MQAGGAPIPEEVRSWLSVPGGLGDLHGEDDI